MKRANSGPAEPPAAGSGRHALAWFAAAALSTLLVDLASKVAAVSGLEGREPLRLLGGAVYLALTRNSGAAFSLGSGYTVVLTAIAIVVIAVICWIARRLRSAPWALSLGLILGGAAGNLVDRLFRAPGPFQGAVIDFISVFDESGGVWPVFNLADSCLVIGVALALWLELTGRRMDGSRVRHSEHDD
ncbi:MAG: signal peptidase II [Micromonosporaceae bacterium]|nr:signal peptidase II [Micromonosporaceae bacterium]